MIAESPIKLAVIGAGPKAAAIAAKAFAMNSVSASEAQPRPSIEVTVFEKAQIGANWLGKSGYTDGEPPLCTHAERDVGFPYLSGYEGVDRYMLSQFSWAAFLTWDRTYADWVNRGRGRPTHARFAEYLEWVFQEAKKPITCAEVDKLSVENGRWVVHGKKVGADRSEVLEQDFDGVVITGPGHARGIPLAPSHTTPVNLFNGENFWTERVAVEAILSKVKDPDILIVGGGGTAAAVISWLVRHGYGSATIQLVAPQPTLFSRSDNSFENLLFTQESYWDTLTPEIRDETFFRLNRGIVWDAVIQDIRHADIIPTSGKANSVERRPDGNARVFCTQSNGERAEFAPDLVVDGTGFDDAWYTSLLNKAVTLTDAQWKLVRGGMGDGLELAGTLWTLPPLHVPLHSSQVGPGFGSLMVLGAMSERILRFHTRRWTASH